MKTVLNHMEKCSNSLETRTIKMKAHRCNFQPIRLAQTQKFYNTLLARNRHTPCDQGTILCYVRVYPMYLGRKNLMRHFIVFALIWMLSMLKSSLSFKAVSSVDTDKHLQCWQQHDPHTRMALDTVIVVSGQRARDKKYFPGAWMVLVMTEGVWGPASQCTSVKYWWTSVQGTHGSFGKCIVCVCDMWSPLKHGFWSRIRVLGLPRWCEWWRTCLPMQGTWDLSIVWEDPTCLRTTKAMCHKYWACALEPTIYDYWAHEPYSLCSTTREATAMRSLCTATKSSLHAAMKTQRSQK